VTPREADEDTLPAAIIALRKSVGSQAKLAAKVGVAERTVKRWERGAMPQGAAKAALIALGLPPRLFERAEIRDEIEDRLRRLEGEIARIRELLA
jgi:transcriptional regulator with XRE-family HTH domain